MFWGVLFFIPALALIFASSRISFKSFVAFLLFAVSTINQLCGFLWWWWWLCLLSVNFTSFVAAGFGSDVFVAVVVVVCNLQL
jgi:hypothetical protein